MICPSAGKAFAMFSRDFDSTADERPLKKRLKNAKNK
jgi:hypothetical protein